MATWNIKEDQEVSMKQVKSGHMHPKMLFLSGIGDYNKIKQGNKIIEVNQG